MTRRLASTAAALAAAVAAGCANVPADDALAPAAAWSQRLHGQAPTLAQDDTARAALAARRAELLAAPLDERSALQIALTASPALQALLAEGWQAQATAAQRGAAPNPFLSFERLSGDGAVSYTRTLGIGLLELLTLPWRRDAAQREVQTRQLALAREVLAQGSAVRAQWVRAVAAQQLVDYHLQVREAAEASAELARRMQSVGNFSRLQRARQQAFLADANGALARAMAQRVTEREALVRLLGLDPAEAAALRLPEHLPDLPASARSAAEVSARAMDERLDLLLARAQLGSAQRDEGLQTVRLFDIELAAVSESSSAGDSSRGYEITLALPLFDSGSASRQADAARTLAAQARLAQARIDATSVLRERYSAYRSAHEIALHQRNEVVPLMKTITDERLLQYNGMLVGVFDLLADARAQVGAVIATLEAERDFWLASMALDAAIVGAPSVAAPIGGGGALGSAAAKDH